jgi:hypothetical protein
MSNIKSARSFDIKTTDRADSHITAKRDIPIVEYGGKMGIVFTIVWHTNLHGPLTSLLQ